MQKRMIVLWRMFLLLNRSSVELLPLLLSKSGFFNSQASSGFLLPSAILIRTALASFSWPLTSNHLGDSGITLQHGKTITFLTEGFSVRMPPSIWEALTISQWWSWIVLYPVSIWRVIQTLYYTVSAPIGPYQVQQHNLVLIGCWM